ncbi:MAG: ribonuclease, partial [Acutalibacteraceae bacterium]|nr:ribonuclease [Acutalibacteraceae bacterium]
MTILSVILLTLAVFSSCTYTAQPVEREDVSKTTKSQTIDKNGSYTSKDDVALYIHTYGELPKN